MFPAPLANTDCEEMSRFEVLVTDSDVLVAKDEVRGAVAKSQDALLCRREVEWLRELEMFVSATEAVTCRADVERAWYDAKLEELREQERRTQHEGRIWSVLLCTLARRKGGAKDSGKGQ